MKYGLTDNILDSIGDILAQHPSIESALIYGSRVKGNFKDASDIDLALKGRNIGLEALTSVIFKLDDLLLPYKFDVTLYGHINNADLRAHIDRVGQVVWDANEIKVK